MTMRNAVLQAIAYGQARQLKALLDGRGDGRVYAPSPLPPGPEFDRQDPFERPYFTANSSTSKTSVE
jgi:hypothetical protein